MRSRTKNHVHEVPSAPASPPCERGSVALIRWTAMALPSGCAKGSLDPSLPAPAPTSTRFGLASSSSRLTSGDFSGSGSADPLSRKRDAWSYIDVRDLARIVDLCLEKDGLGFQVFNATNDEIIANEPTTSSLTKHAPRTPMPANSRGSRLRCPIERRGSFWASASRTTGENVVPVVIDRQPRPADHRCAAACGTFGSRIDAASRSGLHSACGQPGDDIALSQKEYQDRR